MRVHGWWLALIYTLATVLAQGGHDHGERTRAIAPRPEVGRDDPRPQWTGRSAAESGHTLASCLACQYRAENQSWPIAPPSFLRPSVAVAFESCHTLSRAESFRLISCRAPPRA